MGNTPPQGTDAAFLSEQIPRDNQLYQITEDNLFNDFFVAQKYLQELENYTGKFKEEDALLRQREKAYDKGGDILLALGVLTGENASMFHEKEKKWLKNEIYHFTHPHLTFDSLLEKRFLFFRQLFLAIQRFDARQKYRHEGPPSEREAPPQSDSLFSSWRRRRRADLTSMLRRITREGSVEGDTGGFEVIDSTELSRSRSLSSSSDDDDLYAEGLFGSQTAIVETDTMALETEDSTPVRVTSETTLPEMLEESESQQSSSLPETQTEQTSDQTSEQTSEQTNVVETNSDGVQESESTPQPQSQVDQSVNEDDGEQTSENQESETAQQTEENTENVETPVNDETQPDVTQTTESKKEEKEEEPIVVKEPTKEEYLHMLLEDTVDKDLLETIKSRMDEIPSYGHMTYEPYQETEFDFNRAPKVEEEKERTQFPDFESSLICLLTEYVFEIEETALNALSEAASKEHPTEATMSGPSKRPAITLLQILQKELLFTASCLEIETSSAKKEEKKEMEEYAKSVVAFIGSYVHTVINKATVLLNHVFDVNNKLMEQEKDKGNQICQEVMKVLEKSVLLFVINPLATVLCLVFESPRYYDLVSSLLPEMVELLSVLDAFNSLNNTSLGAETNYLEKEYFKLETKFVERKKVETPHNYYPNTDEEKVVTIPGATHLCITFDDRCTVEKDADFLQLYKKPGKVQPIFTAFTGGSDNWPKIPIIVEGDTVVFHFQSNPFNTFWGYRCIVTGLILEAGMAPFWDLEKTLATLTGRLIKTLLVGQPTTPLEEQYADWLASDLFKGGREAEPNQDSKGKGKEKDIEDEGLCKGSFLYDLVYNIKGSEGKSFYEKLHSQVPGMFDSFGGQPADEVVRWFFGVALKHLDLVDTCREQDVESLVKEVMSAAKDVRKWIVQEHQSRLQIMSEQSEQKKKEKEKTEMKKEDLEKEEEEQVDISSYEYLGSCTLAKLKVLCGFKSSGKLKSDITAGLKSLTSFVKLTPDESVQPAISRREITAERRADTFSAIQKLLEVLQLVSVKQDILKVVGPGLREIKSAAEQKDKKNIKKKQNTVHTSWGSNHYSTNTESCGETRHNRLQTAFLSTYSYLIEMFNNNNTDILTLGLISDAFCIDFAPQDYPFLLEKNVLQNFYKLLLGEEGMEASINQSLNEGEKQSRKRLRVLGRLMFRFLAVQCVANADEVGELQGYVLERVIDDLVITVNTFLEQRIELGQVDVKENVDTELSYHKYLKFCYSHLVLLNTVTQTEATEPFLLSPKVVRLLLYIQYVGTPQLQRLSLLMLRRIFSLVEPGTLEKENLTDFFGEPMGLIEYFLQRIGRILFVNGSQRESLTASHTVNFSHNYRAGNVVFAECSEMVMLLRHLLSVPSWSDAIVKAVKGALKCIPKHIDSQNNVVTEECLMQRDVCHRILAALAFVGGHTDDLRVGGRIEVKSTKERGTLVYCDRYSSTIKLILDSNCGRVLTCNPEKVIAISEIGIDRQKFILDDELLGAFKVFVTVPTHNHEEKETVAEAEPQLQWSCSACTFLNENSDMTCGICGTPKSEPETANKVDVDEEQDESPLEHANADVVFHQIKYRAIKALCALIKHPSSAEFAAKEGTLLQLLSAAVVPTQLDEFKSLTQLEIKGNRLFELLYQHQVGMEEEIEPEEVSQSTLLEYSPFKGLPVNLPSGFDRGSARSVAFVTGDLKTIVGKTTEKEWESVGIGRGNFVIPNSLPAFYFEITLSEYNDGPSETEIQVNGSTDPDEPDTEIEGEKKDSDKGKEKTDQVEETGADVALGLFRHGIPLQGVPGQHNSYAYQGKRGCVCHNVGDISNIDDSESIVKFGPVFKYGDVIGCGWNINKGVIYFTVNGVNVGDAFYNAKGRFYPVVWVSENNVRVDMNFGQQPFKYDFVSDLPEGYLDSMADIESKAKVMSAVEIKRRTMAEELMMMMAVFPLELCVLALERSRDDVHYAANWLLEKGYQELDKWMNDAIEISRKEEQNREEHEMRQAIEQAIMEDGGGGEDLAMTEENKSEERVEEASESEEHSDSEEDSDVDDLDAYDEDYNRQAARFLDDELGADVPVQIERREAIVEPIGIEDVRIGMPLRVSPQSEESHALFLRTVGRTGVVAAIDIDSLRIQLRFINSETASKHLLWFYFYDLEKPNSLWQDPCMDELTAAHEEDKEVLPILKHSFVELCNALHILMIRGSVLSLISKWDSLDLSILGGSKYVIDLLKLAASEHLSSKAKGRSDVESVVGDNVDILKSFRAKLAVLLKKEESIGLDEVPPLDLPSYTEQTDLVSMASPSSIITKQITEECILHFVQAVSVPPPIHVEESDHPYSANLDYRKCIHINGASRLIIRFDPRCRTHTDILTRVAFYRDQEYQDPIAIYRGRLTANQFQPIVVESDTVYLRFTTGPTQTHWGYKFSVSPLEWRLNDQQALKGLNFELGYWFLELLLEEGPYFVRNVYIVNLYDALVWYIKEAKRSAKGRGTQLLLRVLREIRKSPLASKSVNLKKILLRRKMESLYLKEIGDAQLLHSTHLQSLVELVAIARLVEDEMQKNEIEKEGKGKEKIEESIDEKGKGKEKVEGSKRKGKEKEEEEYISLMDVGVSCLKINKATYGVLESRKLRVDVTQQMQELVDSYGGSYLWLPPTYQTSIKFLSDLFITSSELQKRKEQEREEEKGEGEEGEAKETDKVKRKPLEPLPEGIIITDHQKRLRISYEIVEKNTGVLLESEWKKTFKRGEAVILKAESSWFANVVNVAGMVQNLLNRNGRFSRRLLMEAYRLNKIRQYHYPLVGNKLELVPGQGIVVDGSVVGNGGAGSSWTIPFWIYLTDDSTGQIRSIMYKGLDYEQVRQSIFLAANDRKVIFTVSTDNDWRECVQSNSEIPLQQWTHVTCCCDSETKQLSIYFDGELDNHRTLSMYPKSNSHPFYIGNVPYRALKTPLGVLGIGGVIRDMRLFIRALTKEEIAELHKAFGRKNRFLRREKELKLSRNIPVVPKIARTELDAFLNEAKSGWGLEALFQITELVSNYCDETKKSPLSIVIDSIKPKEEDINRFSVIRGLSVEEIQFRFSAIKLFNKQLAVVLPLVDFSQAHLSWSLAYSICKLTALIFLETKQKLWNKIMNNTMSGAGKPNITINRPRASRAKHRGDPEGSRSVFGQAFRQLHFIKPESLRLTGQTWRVTFEGEGGQDAGGLFRDSMSEICADLQSPWVPLFVPCPNSSGFGENQGKWIPKASSTNSLQLSMYSFVGKLMGVAIRGKHILNLDLPSMVWKQLVGSEININDLEGIDRHCYKFLEELSLLGLEESGEENFEYKGYTWSHTSSDGTVVELRPNGVEIPVKWEEREAYREAILDWRLNEFRLQVEHIKKGMGTIVPVQLLSLFTWQELELNVCGKAHIDVDFLRENTKYQGFSEDDKYVQMLWEVLRGFSDKQRELFLRFAWGRSRLPINSEDFIQKFVVMGCRYNNDNVLPISHTCFFQLELPKYSKVEVMRQKILYAITECRAIDTDHRVTNEAWEEEDDNTST